MPLTINSEYIDPILGMLVPTAQTPGELYANDLSNDLITRIAPHTHTGVANLDGYQLDADSLNLTMDINFNGTNLDNVRSLRLDVQTSPLNGAQDVNSVYDTAGDLWFNDGTGTAIRITENGGVVTSSAFLSFTGQTVSTATYTIPNNATFNLVNIAATTTFMSTITLPLISAISVQPVSRFFLFVDTGDNSGTNPITIQVAGGSGNTINVNGIGESLVVINGDGQSALLFTNGDGVWQYLPFGQNTYYEGQSLTFLASSLLTVESGADIVLNGGIVLGGPSVISGTSTLTANITVSSGSLILQNTGSILAEVPNCIQITAVQGLELSTAESVQINVPNALAVNVSNGIALTAANALTSNVTGGIVLSGGSNDYPTFNPPRTVSYSFSIGPLISTDYGTSGWVANGVIWTGGPNPVGVHLPMLHNAATLNSISIKMFNQTGSRTPPGQAAQFVMYGQALADGTSSSSLYPLQHGNFILGSATAPSALYTNSNIVSMTASSLSNNVINTAANMYFLLLTDEAGSNSVNNQYIAVVLNYTISNMQFAL